MIGDWKFFWAGGYFLGVEKMANHFFIGVELFFEEFNNYDVNLDTCFTFEKKISQGGISTRKFGLLKKIYN